MLKYVDSQVTFSEVPDEITLCLNISNCPIQCRGCHSQYLWQDIGEPLTKARIEDLLTSNRGITCICFMGGDREPVEVNELSKWVHKNYGNSIKTAWYSGRDTYPTFTPDFDYIKIGQYIEKCGPINIPTTNQKMVKVYHENDSWYMEDITKKFWKNDS